jgi:pyruvate/oxaloacetate carboxyltransferase
MRILFDQGAPVPIAAWLREHTVRTTLEEKWDTLVNGELLRVSEQAGFDVLLTTDNNIAYQQNLTGRKIAIVVLSGNRWRLVQRVIRKIVSAINKAEPGSYTVIDVPTR